MSIYNYFDENKYTEWYIKLVESRKNRKLSDKTYYEIHHIIPKCIDGSNEDENLVKLTLREHYIAHLLLTKMFSDKIITSKMYFGLSTFRQSHNESRKNYKFTSHQYKVLRESHYKSLSLNHPMKGKTPSKETKDKISKANTGKIRSEEFKTNRSIYMKIPENNPFYGRDVSGKKNPMYGLKGAEHPSFGLKRTDEQKEKIRNTHLGKPKSDEHKEKLSIIAKNRKGCKYYNNGLRNIKIKEGQDIPDGYIRGKMLIKK